MKWAVKWAAGHRWCHIHPQSLNKDFVHVLYDFVGILSLYFFDTSQISVHLKLTVTTSCESWGWRQSMYQKQQDRENLERLYSDANTAKALEESVSVCVVCSDRWRWMVKPGENYSWGAQPVLTPTVQWRHSGAQNSSQMWTDKVHLMEQVETRTDEEEETVCDVL